LAIGNKNFGTNIRKISGASVNQPDSIKKRTSTIGFGKKSSTTTDFNDAMTPSKTRKVTTLIGSNKDQILNKIGNFSELKVNDTHINSGGGSLLSPTNRSSIVPVTKQSMNKLRRHTVVLHGIAGNGGASSGGTNFNKL
jgi:hypothetical protein